MRFTFFFFFLHFLNFFLHLTFCVVYVVYSLLFYYLFIFILRVQHFVTAVMGQPGSLTQTASSSQRVTPDQSLLQPTAL